MDQAKLIRRNSLVRVFLFLLLVLSFVLSASAEPEAEVQPYLSDLIEASHSPDLSRDHYWNLLLHYKPRWFGGMKSEADGENFFYSAKGRKNPRAELEATLEAFFDPPIADPEKQHPQCKFQARYQWLRERLGFDDEKLRPHPCPRLDAWKKGVRPESVTLIFASYFVNNPASMFGHTFIRFDQAGERGKHDLLDYSINYAANIGENPGLFYPVFGLTGGYRGTFSMHPYYFKVQEYSNVESRDLWEYELSLNAEQIDRMMNHLWELGQTYFDYYFVDENCSYHLLSLLELAEPEAKLRDSLHVFVAPSDTVRAVVNGNLVRHIAYRPSKLSRVREKLSMLTRQEKASLQTLLDADGTLESSQFTGWPQERTALVADTAIELLDYRKEPGERDPHLMKLLAERADLGPAPKVSYPPHSEPPQAGHKSVRAGIGGGLDNDDSFEEIRFRLSYQDLLADDAGYPENAEIEFARIRLRFYNEEKKVHLEDGTLINIVSLFPIDRFIKKPSWNLSLGWTTLRNNDCGRCNALYLQGGPGITFSSHLLKREVLYFLFNAMAEISPWSAVDYRIGPQGRGGLLVDFFDWWKLNLDGTVDYSPLGAPDVSYEGRVAQRFSPTKNTEFRLEGKKFRRGAEATLGFMFYF